MKFNRWTVIKLDKGDRYLHWICQCECGAIKSITSSKLINGKSKSCGCIRKDMGISNRRDLIGMKFGRLTVVERAEFSVIGGKSRAMWLCECNCGNRVVWRQDKLVDIKYGTKASCGCLGRDNLEQVKLDAIKRKELKDIEKEKLANIRKEKADKNKKIIADRKQKTLEIKQRRDNMIGNKIDMLTVVEYLGRGMFKCVCDCGNIIEKAEWNLCKENKTDVTKSCGCYKNSHGLSGTRIYNIWKGMRRRCYSESAKDYKNYGGRGIRFSDSWLDFMEFFKDMNDEYIKHTNKYGEKNTSIDRINSSGNYCKENCRWATASVQANNRRPKILPNS